MTNSAGVTAVEATALAIAIEQVCGLTIKGRRALCDDPEAAEARHSDCECRRSALAAIKAYLAALPPPEAAGARREKVEAAIRGYKLRLGGSSGGIHEEDVHGLASVVLALPHSQASGEVVEALRPFAEAAECVERDEADDYGLEGSSARYELTIGDLRRAGAALSRSQAPQPAAGKDSDPHPNWKPGRSSRHPEAVEEWDYRNDPTGGAFERSLKRLAVAGDYDDPRAPDQMALVLRIDIIRLISDWQHKNAAWESWRHRFIKDEPAAPSPQEKPQ